MLWPDMNKLAQVFGKTFQLHGQSKLEFEEELDLFRCTAFGDVVDEGGLKGWFRVGLGLGLLGRV